jgi:hypothetical protein
MSRTTNKKMTAAAKDTNRSARTSPEGLRNSDGYKIMTVLGDGNTSTLYFSVYVGK